MFRHVSYASKSIITLIFIATPFLSHAGGEFSGTSKRKRFKASSAIEAFYSKEFKKKITNIHMPGTNSWYKPVYEICLDGNEVRTVRKEEFCSLYVVSLKEPEFGSSKKYFESFQKAQQKARSTNGNGKVRCAEGAHDHVSVPVRYQEKVCTTWRVRVRGANSFEYFARERSAEAFVRTSGRAQSGAVCVEEGVVVRRMDTSFRVKFYADRKAQEFLGEHQYQLPKCSEVNKQFPITRASGEYSGTGKE